MTFQESSEACEKIFKLDNFHLLANAGNNTLMAILKICNYNNQDVMSNMF